MIIEKKNIIHIEKSKIENNVKYFDIKIVKLFDNLN